MKRLPYGAGDWFAVPLQDEGYGVGVVARMAPGGRVLLGYFFGPRRSELPNAGELGVLKPDGALMVRRFGDLGLFEGKWPLIGQTSNWSPSDWSMPVFGRWVELGGVAYQVEYEADDPNAPVETRPVQIDEINGLPKDGMLGSEAVETLMTALINEKPGVY